MMYEMRRKPEPTLLPTQGSLTSHTIYARYERDWPLMTLSVMHRGEMDWSTAKCYSRDWIQMEMLIVPFCPAMTIAEHQLQPNSIILQASRDVVILWMHMRSDFTWVKVEGCGPFEITACIPEDGYNVHNYGKTSLTHHLHRSITPLTSIALFGSQTITHAIPL